MPNSPGPDVADDDERFTRLFEQSYAVVRRFVERRVGAGQVDYVVAETFLVAWRRLDDLPGDERQRQAWLYATARNVMANDVRTGRRWQALAVRLASEPNPSAGETDGIDGVAARIDLQQAWHRLSAVHQEALALTVLDGLGATDAARVLGISPVAYRLRLSRARRALRLLANLEIEPDPPAQQDVSGQRHNSSPSIPYARATAPHGSTP